MGILRITIDDTIRVSATKARIHTVVSGSSVLLGNAAVKRSAEVRGLVQALAAVGVASDSWSLPSPRVELAAQNDLYAAKEASSAPLDLGIDINSTQELFIHLSVDFEMSS